MTQKDEENKEERNRQRLKRLRNQKKTVRRYVNLNHLFFMYTFTFAISLNDNVIGLSKILPLESQRHRTEIERIWNSRLSIIRKALGNSGTPFRFLKVLEPHNSEKSTCEKRGAFHIHLATDRWIDKGGLQKLWKYGNGSTSTALRHK